MAIGTNPLIAKTINQETSTPSELMLRGSVVLYRILERLLTLLMPKKQEAYKTEAGSYLHGTNKRKMSLYLYSYRKSVYLHQ